MELTFDEVKFSQMSFFEKIGYLYGLIFKYKEELISILNDRDESDSNKFLYSIVMTDGLANTLNCVLELIEMREQFRFTFFLENGIFLCKSLYRL